MRYEKEKQEVIDWLKHPNELGKEPSKIEFVKEFTDDDSNCLIFKYKKGLFSPWLLAIHSEAVGVFSEQEKYDEKRDIEQAKKLLDFLKQYWKSVAKSVEEAEKRKEKAKKFSGFVLKAEPEFEPDEFLKMYEEDWGERLKDDDGHGEKKEGVDARIFENENGLRLVIGYMDFRVPDNEAEENAIYNWMWKDAVATTEKHKAHEVVTIMGDGEIKEQAMFYAKAVLTLCRMENNIGVYANGVVYQPELFFAMEKCIRNGELPIPVLVWIGLGREEDGISAWTDGMK
ncbi:MAG: hypothetical protein IJ736_11030, partial [Firmicutes bacterium]|nr:hypothetical protein [Bacillota bacterium]